MHFEKIFMVHFLKYQGLSISKEPSFSSSWITRILNFNLYIYIFVVKLLKNSLKILIKFNIFNIKMWHYLIHKLKISIFND